MYPDLMPTKQAIMWKVMQDYLPKSEQVEINQIYEVVSNHVTLELDDWEPAAKGSRSDPRWRRNIRNILQHRKLTSDILWLGNGMYMMPPSTDSATINSSVPSGHKISKRDFEKLQITRAEIGEKGENHTLEYERSKLAKAGRADLAQMVTRVSLIDVGAGYDIKSFEIDGQEKYIEVKTTMGYGRMFEWSSNEYEVAKTLGNQYWIYQIRDIGDKPKVLEIQDPISKVGTFMEIRPNSYLVRVTQK
jgi:hypothetical protein